ncbi:hypothetical protein LJC42_05305 [Eubacteriales bacterium OttesenSCG-928-K08]|nr:hypothetical protein [Eubacteriales bacterium OttesenSCG-928-K08]
MPPPFIFMKGTGVCVEGDPPKRNKKKKKDFWPVKVFFLTFLLAFVFSLFAETTLLGVSLPVALLVLMIIILIGILFDVVGIAVTFQDVSAYTAMASKKIQGARQAMRLVQSADTVSNICNDMVGDICGIISGAMGAAIAARLVIDAATTEEFWIAILVSALTAALTVGGKALGKRYAMRYSRQIVFFVGKFFSIFARKQPHK